MARNLPPAPLFTIEQPEPRLLVQRYKASMRFEPDHIRKAARALERSLGGEPHALLVIIPPEVPVAPEATNVDHFLGERDHRRIAALAVVAPAPLMHSVSRFYFNWFPQPFPARVFRKEAAALEWLRTQVPSALGRSRSAGRIAHNG